MGSEKVFSGRIWNGDHFEDGHLTVDDGILKDVMYGETVGDADFTGCMMPGIVDTHTHVADAGLRLDRRYGLEELVAPPDGLKHRYLKDTDTETIRGNMAGYISRLTASGVSRFIDFREGGAEGSRLLRQVSDRAVILGRPVSEEYDPNEIDDILRYADGIGIPSITDMDHAYIDAIADHIHRKNAMLALHVSERTREDIDYVISLQPDLIVHMVQATDADLRKCADSDIPISVCPSSNLYFGMVPPVSRMLDAGVSVSLGTDNGMLFPSADIFEELRSLSRLLLEQGRGPSDAFRIALACGHKVLYENPLTVDKTGKRADFIAFPCTEKELLAGAVGGSVRCGP
ncbi:MAG: amidohydrolase family protein [Candidatus Methanomethylophilaceae archaeon]|nr:amidohydrolase family protein [Candidatus Methanomethylophilaceae archaeon]